MFAIDTVAPVLHTVHSIIRARAPIFFVRVFKGTTVATNRVLRKSFELSLADERIALTCNGTHTKRTDRSNDKTEY